MTINASLTLKQASEKRWEKQVDGKLPGLPQGLRVIKQQLWCCCGGARIVIFDSGLQQQRTLWADDMGMAYDVAEMRNGDVVIAASNGLYRRSKNGECHRRNVW